MISTGFIAAALVLGTLFLAPRPAPAQGTGSHPDGGFTWQAKMTVADGRPVIQHGSVHFSPNAQSVSCGAGLLTATGSAVLP